MILPPSVFPENLDGRPSKEFQVLLVPPKGSWSKACIGSLLLLMALPLNKALKAESVLISIKCRHPVPLCYLIRWYCHKRRVPKLVRPVSCWNCIIQANNLKLVTMVIKNIIVSYSVGHCLIFSSLSMISE